MLPASEGRVELLGCRHCTAVLMACVAFRGTQNAEEASPSCLTWPGLVYCGFATLSHMIDASLDMLLASEGHVELLGYRCCSACLVQKRVGYKLPSKKISMVMDGAADLQPLLPCHTPLTRYAP